MAKLKSFEQYVSEKEANIDQDAVNTQEVQEATVVMDAVDPKSKGLAKLLKKNNVSIEVVTKVGPSGWPEVELTGDRKDLEIVLADSQYGWDDADLAEYIEESKDTFTVKVKSIEEGAKEEEIEEGNAFGDAVRKAKEAGDKEFEFDGKTYKVEEAVTEAKFDKKKLMKAMKHDDGIIQLANGDEFIIYNPDNGNDENTAMWNDKVIFALDQDGEEHEVKYSDIVSYNEANN